MHSTYVTIKNHVKKYTILLYVSVVVWETFSLYVTHSKRSNTRVIWTTCLINGILIYTPSFNARKPIAKQDI